MQHAIRSNQAISCTCDAYRCADAKPLCVHLSWQKDLNPLAEAALLYLLGSHSNGKVQRGIPL